MNALVIECIGEKMNECINEWKNTLANAFVNEWMR